MRVKEAASHFTSEACPLLTGGEILRYATADTSRGPAGGWIERGRRAHPVSEITIAGNLKDMFRNLTPADDLEFRHGTNAPTVRIDGMTVAGN